MAWYNPATWTAVDNLQGQNKKTVQKSSPSLNYNKDSFGAGEMSGGLTFAPGGTMEARMATPTKSTYGQYNSQGALDANSRAYTDYQAMLAEAMRPVAAPYYNVDAAMASAKSQAAASVNPYYDKQMELFLKGQAAELAQQKQTSEWNLRDINDTLTNTLAGNQTNRGRTAEDVQLNQEAINTNEQNMQADTGSAFDKERIAMAKSLASGGMTTSGAGAQQMTDAQGMRNTAEARQVQQYALARNAQELFKTRTFEDLAKSDEFANVTATKGTERENFSLASYITNQNIAKEVNQLVQNNQRANAIEAATKDIYSAAGNAWIRGLTNPKQQVAARGAYGF